MAFVSFPRRNLAKPSSIEGDCMGTQVEKTLPATLYTINKMFEYKKAIIYCFHPRGKCSHNIKDLIAKFFVGDRF